MACCDNCGNFDKMHVEDFHMVLQQKELDQHNPFMETDKNLNYQPNLYYYWQYPLEEDYQMPNGFECLCEICFDILNAEGKIKWKEETV